MGKKSLLQQMAASQIEKGLSGYIGTRVAPDLEREFKKHCKRLGISVADALRLLIETELKEANGAPGVPVVSPAVVQTQAAPAAPSIPKNTGQKSIYTRGAYDKFKVINKAGNNVLPCPICGNFSGYSSFKQRHTQKHGFEDTAEFLNAHIETVRDMINQYDG